jgi:hypothetical protein
LCFKYIIEKKGQQDAAAFIIIATSVHKKRYKMAENFCLDSFEFERICYCNRVQAEDTDSNLGRIKVVKNSQFGDENKEHNPTEL